MEHTFDEILEALKKEEDWGPLEGKKAQKIAGLEMQLMRL